MTFASVEIFKRTVTLAPQGTQTIVSLILIVHATLIRSLRRRAGTSEQERCEEGIPASCRDSRLRERIKASAMETEGSGISLST